MRVLCIVPLLLAAQAAPAEPDGWQLLKSLTGEWEGTMDGHSGTARLTYEVVSNGSAVVERLRTGSEQNDMITVYHRDGKALVLTHYCAAGNQPRMKAGSSAAPNNRISFEFLDIANLASPDAAHMRTLTMTFPDPNHIVQEWGFREKGKDTRSIFRYKRK